MAKMTEERRGQIALALLEASITSRGIPARRELMQKIDESHKVTGIDKDELMDFFVSCVPKTLSKILDVEVTGLVRSVRQVAKDADREAAENHK